MGQARPAAADGKNPGWDQAVFWDRSALRAETTRVLDICHGCRRCVQLCPSFTNVFKRIDAIEDQLNPAPAGGYKPAGASAQEKDLADAAAQGYHVAVAREDLASMENPVEALTDADHRVVVDECYHCNLCFNMCPYHPPHRFALDFPKLMTRHKAVGLKEGRGSWRDRTLAQVDRVGALSCLLAPLVNRLNRFRPHRLLLRFILGVHPDRDLPLFHFETFRRWWDRRGPKARSSGRIALFYTCSVDYNEPRIGKAAVAVFEKNGFEVVCPEQSCCGMPHLDYGNLDAARDAARRNVARFLPYAQQGVPIVALGPTCSYMLKREYPELLKTDASRAVAAAALDLTEFLMKLKREGRLSRDFAALTQKIAYQPACHLKNQNIGLKSKELLELLPGASVAVVDRCTGHDGTWSMKQEYFELSMKYAQKLFDEIERSKPDVVSTDCPLAAIQLKQGTGREPKHPIELVAQAYGLSTD